MAYTSPRTWVAGEVLTAALLNTHVRDNMIALKDPPTSIGENMASSYTTTSTSFVNVDAVGLSLTITTTGGRVLVAAIGRIYASVGTTTVYLDIATDGTREGNANYGLHAEYGLRSTDLEASTFTILYLTDVLSAGSHTFKLQWRNSAGGTTTTMPSVHMFAREVS